MPRFHHYIGVDYSGAATPEQSLPGLRVFLATRASSDAPATPPAEVPPPPSPRTYWTRREIAAWLSERVAEAAASAAPVIVGIDHGFSFPRAYFQAHGIARDWDAFLDDFVRHWPTDGEFTYVDFVRDGSAGDGAARSGSARWRRRCELRAGGAKSVFHFDVPGSVAKSTHAGLPWLRRVRRAAGERLHAWPFDGFAVPAGRSVIAEVYPSLWSRAYPREGRTGDQHDAYTVAAWLRDADGRGALGGFLEPGLDDIDRAAARYEGWILGVR